MTLKSCNCNWLMVVKERKVYANPDMNIMLRAIVRNTVNVCGQRFNRS